MPNALFQGSAHSSGITWQALNVKIVYVGSTLRRTSSSVP